MLPREFGSTFIQPMGKKCQYFSRSNAPQLMQSAHGNEFLQPYLMQHKAAAPWSVFPCTPWRYATITVQPKSQNIWPSHKQILCWKYRLQWHELLLILCLAPIPLSRYITNAYVMVDLALCSTLYLMRHSTIKVNASKKTYGQNKYNVHYN